MDAGQVRGKPGRVSVKVERGPQYAAMRTISSEHRRVETSSVQGKLVWMLGDSIMTDSDSPQSPTTPGGSKYRHRALPPRRAE